MVEGRKAVGGDEEQGVGAAGVDVADLAAGDQEAVAEEIGAWS